MTQWDDVYTFAEKKTSRTVHKYSSNESPIGYITSDFIKESTPKK